MSVQIVRALFVVFAPHSDRTVQRRADQQVRSLRTVRGNTKTIRRVDGESEGGLCIETDGKSEGENEGRQ